MPAFRSVMIVTALASTTACSGKKQPDDGTPPPTGSGTAGRSASAPPAAAPDAAPVAPPTPTAPCSETTAATITFAAGVPSPLPAAFQVTSSLAFWKTDPAGSGVRTSVVLGNYAVRDTFGPRSTVSYNEPAQPSEAALELTFQSDQPLTPGAYAAGTLDKPGAFGAVLHIGGATNLPTFSDQGKVTLTVASDTRLCGSFEAADDAGSTIKGSFNLPLVDHRAGRAP